MCGTVMPPPSGLILDDSSLLGAGSYVDGAFCKGGKDDLIVTNPANDGVVRRVSTISSSDLARAITSAAKSFPTWRDTPSKRRAFLLREWSAHITRAKADLVRIITLENGKPLHEASWEVDYAAGFVEWYSAEAVRGHALNSSEISPGVVGSTVLEPLGVVVAISPWNFPAAMIVRKVAPALAAGCTCIAKPSDETPLASLALAELAARAGIPTGVFNVVVCQADQAPDVVATLLRAPPVRMVTFTGSTRVGIEVGKVAAERSLRNSFELGGNAPFIVYDDADLTLAVEDMMSCKFRNAGQTCISCNRAFVQDTVYDAVVSMLRSRISELGRRMGNGLREGVEVGPLIHQRAVQRVSSLVHDARSKGAVVEVGGHVGFGPDSNGSSGVSSFSYNRERNEDDARNTNLHGGSAKDSETPSSNDSAFSAASREVSSDNFYAPTLLTNVHDNMDVSSEEIFGPVLALFRFETESEVLDRAGRSTAATSSGGLAAYLYTRSHARARRAARELHVGMVGINTRDLSDPRTSFGGVCLSGSGREGGQGLEEYSARKYVVDSIGN